MRQLLESRYDKSTFAIVTWRGDAQRYWLTQVLDCARNRHDQWLQSTPSQRASLEPAYILGDRKHIPEAQNAVESVLRTELLDVIPKSIADACMRHGYCTAELLVWYVMKQLILPHEINEVTMQKEILTHPKVAPSALDQGCAWLEEMQHRLNLCMKTGQQVHPRTIITFVQEVLSGITQYYRTVGNIWESLYLKHQLRDSNLTIERVYAMLAEFLIELRSHEEQDKIVQIVTGSSSTVKHSMYDEYINASKGKVRSQRSMRRPKARDGDGKGSQVQVARLRVRVPHDLLLQDLGGLLIKAIMSEPNPVSNPKHAQPGQVTSIFAMLSTKSMPTWRHSTWDGVDYMICTVIDPQKKLPVFNAGKWSLLDDDKIYLYGHDAKTMKKCHPLL